MYFEYYNPDYNLKKILENFEAYQKEKCSKYALHEESKRKVNNNFIIK
jgi:hypothetical protein